MHAACLLLAQLNTPCPVTFYLTGTMKRLNLVPLQCALVSGWTFRLVDAGYRSNMGRGSVTDVGTRFNCEGIIKRFVLCKKYLIF